uniref:Transcription initiation factor TFIID subunit 12 n=1 Tax=Schistocephalus solidus TaxID=70667 RepID=A0A0V0J6L8_SCHSO
MNTRNDASLPQPTAPNLVFHPSTVTQGALVSVTSGMQMWSQSTPQVTDSSGRFIQLPRQAILMTNIAGAANSTASGTNTSASSAFIRTPVSSIATASPSATPLIFAASTPDGTALVRAPLPTQLVTSQLAPSASATPPLTSFVLGTPSGTPTSATVVVSNVGTPAVAAAAALTTSSPTQPAPIAITSSHSASAVLDQAQPPPSSPMPKVVSFQSVAVESPGSQTVTPTPPSQDSTAAEVAPPAPTQSVYSNSDASQSMVFTAKSLSDLVKETDPDLQLDDETEEALMQLSEEFVENVAEKAIRLAIHRGSPVVEAKDVKFTLDRDWNIFVPGFPSSEKTWKRPFVLQAHKQRLAYAKKQLKRT